MSDEYEAAAELENTLSRWDGDDDEEGMAYPAEEDDGDSPQNMLEKIEDDIREIQYYIMISTDYYEREAQAKVGLQKDPKNGGNKSLKASIEDHLYAKCGNRNIDLSCSAKYLEEILAELLEHTKANHPWACYYIWNNEMYVKEVIAAYLQYLKVKKKKEKAKQIRVNMIINGPRHAIANKDMEMSAQEVYYTCLSIKRKKKKTDAMKQDAYHYSVIQEACERHNENMGVEDDDYEDSVEARILCLTKSEEYEFKVAFSVVAGVDEISFFNKVHIGQIEEVFLAIGLTLQTFDLKEIVNNIELDSNDECTCEQLKDAYEIWRRHQIPVSMLKALFNKILKDNRLPLEGSFPVEYKTLNHGTLTLDSQSICNIVNKVQDLSGNSRLKTADIMTTINELKSTKGSGVSFRDFVSIFSTEEKVHA